MSKVMKCGIEECVHNNNMECRADGIEVRSSTNNKKCSQSEHTCCDTFAPRV
ncbi:DUF1540 domain-containing protein [Desulfofundulus thermobenzoicus]|uniref:DUF1540 domain-containing protein n=1 Tax=Desulfofundulus thermobenzoicus TaxID=29376 RepID=A0A6N7ITY3_9FIRM|nr:DUF1540 domain-containing protein [Desulfofundulus thermobenzoicus]HHW44603.1 DUF1540 domain-containing protein [Desulfotomaculum sp.]